MDGPEKKGLPPAHGTFFALPHPQPKEDFCLAHLVEKATHWAAFSTSARSIPGLIHWLTE